MFGPFAPRNASISGIQISRCAIQYGFNMLRWIKIAIDVTPTVFAAQNDGAAMITICQTGNSRQFYIFGQRFLLDCLEKYSALRFSLSGSARPARQDVQTNNSIGSVFDIIFLWQRVGTQENQTEASRACKNMLRLRHTPSGSGCFYVGRAPGLQL